MDGAGRVEHERARPGNDATRAVVVGAFQDVDLLAEA